MCGIAGFTTFRGAAFDIGERSRAMLAAVHARGPDGAGFFTDSNVTLAHCRLSIIDHAGGAQPMKSPDGRHILAFNGEIYNYLELRADLEKRGRSFHSDSDTEVLLALLAEEGAQGLTRCRGMFALACWDTRDRALVLARDASGMKPLYYAVRDGELIFASTLDALLQHPAISRRVRPASVVSLLSLGYIPAPHSILDHVFKLDAGCWLSVDAGGVREGRFAPLAGAAVEEGVDEETWSDRLEAALRDSVRLHMRADVPVGILLSGGVDSSLVASLAAEVSPRPLPAFTVGFSETSYDESSAARRVANVCGLEHHVEVLNDFEASSVLADVMQAMDEPLGDASMLPTWILARLCRRSVKVGLGGEGGDELFGGYPAFGLQGLVRAAPWVIGACDFIARHRRASDSYTSWQFHARQIARAHDAGADERLLLWMGVAHRREVASLLTPEANQQASTFDHESFLRDRADECGRSGLDRDLHLCRRTYLQDGVLAKVDRASMSHALEVRVPLLDPRLLDLSLAMPAALKRRGLASKVILRRVASRHLPTDVVQRRKRGFMFPLARWLRTTLAEPLEVACREWLPDLGLIDTAAALRLAQEHQSGVSDHRKVLWTLLALGSWWQRARVPLTPRARAQELIDAAVVKP